MTEAHADQGGGHDAPPDLSSAVLSFDGPRRLALTLHMAGYSDDQVAKLIARGISEGAGRERRAA